MERSESKYSILILFEYRRDLESPLIRGLFTFDKLLSHQIYNKYLKMNNVTMETVASLHSPYGRVKVKPFNFSREVQSTKSSKGLKKEQI